MRIALFILLFLPFLSLSQINQTDTNGLRQGLWKKQYPNGVLMYEGNFEDGKPVGEWKRYHEGGQVKATINYTEYSDSAFAQLFNQLGKKVAEGNYFNERKTGSWILFSENIKIAEEQFINGNKHGYCRKFYNTGELLEEAEWALGKQEGKYHVFYKNGKPYMQCKFKNNIRNGLCLLYFQNGKMEMEGNYKYNLRHGSWKYYNEKGELLYELKYNEGQLLNYEVRDSIDNLQMQNLERGKNSLVDPEKFMENPSEYMLKNKIYR